MIFILHILSKVTQSQEERNGIISTQEVSTHQENNQQMDCQEIFAKNWSEKELISRIYKELKI